MLCKVLYIPLIASLVGGKAICFYFDTLNTTNTTTGCNDVRRLSKLNHAKLIGVSNNDKLLQLAWIAFIYKAVLLYLVVKHAQPEIDVYSIIGGLLVYAYFLLFPVDTTYLGTAVPHNTHVMSLLIVGVSFLVAYGIQIIRKKLVQRRTTAAATTATTTKQVVPAQHYTPGLAAAAFPSTSCD